MGEIPANPDAIRSCAPYGIIPCTKQEKMSRILAERFGSILNLVDISFAIGPAIISAMVLFAVQTFAKPTSPGR